MVFLNSLLDAINAWIGKTNVLIIVLFGGGIIFSIALKLYSLNFKQLFGVLKRSNTKSKAGITGFQSLMIATAQRIGNGNIAGVASAVMVGGPGALFWMWMTALIGMSTSFCEGVLAQLYKEKRGNDFVGGAPFYIKKFTGKNWIGGVYAIFAIAAFGFAYMGVQSHTIAANFYSVAGKFFTSIPANTLKMSVGIALGLAVFAIVFGGAKSIGKFAATVMPVMGSLYLITALVIVFKNFGKTGEVWSFIINGAFGTRQVLGGITGYTLSKAINKGVARGVFSNEAGIGSGSFAASASNSTHPVQQGLLQSLSTFIDTIIVCTASGFIILYSGVWTSHAASDSSTLIQSSIASQLGGTFAEWLVFFAILIFGLTTIIGNLFYAELSFSYFTKSKSAERIMQLVIILFMVMSSVFKTDFVWNLEGPVTLGLVIINIFTMLPQIPLIRLLTSDYKDQIAKGKLSPIYEGDKKLGKDNFWNNKK